MNTAVELGVVEKTSRGYQFSHDTLTRCKPPFNPCFLPADDKLRLHKIIGQAFLQHAQSHESKCHAAVHLYKAVSQMDDAGECLQVARVNLDSTRYCENTYAFDKAASLL